MSRIQEIIDKVHYLYPTSQYPTKKSQWDIGHKCLAYFEQTLPLSRMLLPWYLKQKIFQDYCNMPSDFNKTPEGINDLLEAENVGYEQLTALRKEKKGEITSINLIKKYKVANCQEISDVAYNWMTKQGVRCYSVLCSFSDKEHYDLQCGHVLLLYRNDKVVQSCRKMMANLNDPNVRILDMLFQQCGQAYDVLNEITKESVSMGNAENIRPLKQGDILQLWNQNLANDDDLENLNTYSVGVVQSGLFTHKKLVLNNQPQSEGLNKDMLDFIFGNMSNSMQRS